jgi:DNA-binding transcriptional LysR family regulator
MNITLRQMEAFLEIMRLNSVTKAAHAIGRTQPAVSLMLSALETELGLPLFSRDRGRLIPLPEAHYFQEQCQTVLDQMNVAKSIMHEIVSMERGRLTLAAFPAFSNFILPKEINRFLEGKEGFKMTLITYASETVIEMVASQHCEIGIARLSGPRPTIESINFELPCQCAMPIGDPLAALDVITPAELSGKPLASMFAQHPMFQQVAATFERFGAEYNVRFEMQTFQPALPLVEAGQCYLICDAITVESYRLYAGDQPKLAFRPFFPQVMVGLSIMTPSQRPLSRPALALRDQLVASMEEMVAVSEASNG